MPPIQPRVQGRGRTLGPSPLSSGSTIATTPSQPGPSKSQAVTAPKSRAQTSYSASTSTPNSASASASASASTSAFASAAASSSASASASAFPSAPNSTPGSSAFSPQARTLGEGVPGFKTSFDVSGKGGGAFKPISENFSVSPATGTMSFSLPIHASESRGGYGPELALGYDSGSGNGSFGFGWTVPVQSIHRKTTHAIPRYTDSEDDFAMAGADIVKQFTDDGTIQTRAESGPWGKFHVAIYRPRVDTRSVRIERWTSEADPADVHWRTISADNATAIYGDSDASRIADTSDGRRRIFSWMLSRSYDACGNAVEYTYKQEDGKGIANANGSMPAWERNRSQESRCRQKYIKRVKYGNRTPNRDLVTWEASKWPEDWMFELVFDYGEHDQDNPSTADSHTDWPVRQDPFSQYHAGFEVRTYRLCRRVLMFHHFPERTKLSENLVSSTTMKYEESPQRTVLTGLIISGHSIDNNADPAANKRYRSESMPQWTFQYTGVPDPDRLATVEANIINLLDLPSSQAKVSEWLDLDSEGMPGLLTKFSDGTLCYQRNIGPSSSSDDDEPQFGGPVVLAQQPSFTGGTFQDLDRNGRLNYVLRDVQGRLLGYFERGDSDTWSSYSDFPETPNGAMWQETIDIDLTGDGLADVLSVVDEPQTLIWQQNLGKKGLSGYRRIYGPEDSSRPQLSQGSDMQTQVADMTGSGLSDLVEISAASVRYWPNLGYGTFGAVVEMGNAPIFSTRDDYDQSRVRLIDVDGSGTTDLLYLLPTGGAALYYNLAGNSWSDRVFIPQLPMTADPSSVFTLDILGKGTGCLCWADTSSERRRIKYIDLMGDTKPHLLESYSNGLGSNTTITYKPSTRFYVEDERRGMPWSTKLPFPVHCISKVAVADAITGNQHSTEYIYHNGCYDPVEKQFAGFEMVEEFRREKLIIGENETYEPPAIYTKSWYSVGLSLGVDQSQFLTRPLVASTMQVSDGDPAERLQALKGMNLRTETYGQDGTEKSLLPFHVQESSYELKLVQSRSSNKYSVVQVCKKETLTKEYERNMQDERIVHDIILKANPFGDVEESLHIVYPRTMDTAFTDVNKNQKTGTISHSRTWFTSDVTGQYSFRKPATQRQQQHDIVNFPFKEGTTLSVEQARAYDFQGLPTAECAGGTWKALKSENWVFYKDSLLKDRLKQGKLEAHSLLDKAYTLAFTPEIVAKIEMGLRNCKVAGKVDDLLEQGKYVKLAGSDNWWVPSSESLFCPPGSSAAEELKEARRSFYTPSYFVDIFGNMTRMKLDKDFLMAEETEDAVGNITRYDNNYQLLRPVKIVDSNLNATEVVIDSLGHTIAAATLGKELGDEEDVDSVKDLVLDVSPEDVDSILLDPTGEVARRVLGNAGSRTVYCINHYALWKAEQDAGLTTSTKLNQTPNANKTPPPTFLLSLTRDLPYARSSNPDIHVSISYLNGLGASLQEVQLNDPNDFGKMWLISGLAIADSEGHAICSYEPCFASSPAPILAENMKTNSAVAFYDATGRGVAALTAECTWSKTTHAPWATTEYSTSDLVLKSRPQDDPDVGHFFARVRPARYLKSWYDKHRLDGTRQEKRGAEKSVIYADAPIITHDSGSGQPIRSVRIAGGKTYTRRFEYDVHGNRVQDLDSYDRLVERIMYDKLGRTLQSTGMDRGESWTLQDAQDTELLSWNCRGYSFTTRYDGLHREVEKLVRKGTGAQKLVTRITYGESSGPGAAALNLKTKVWKVEDQSGVHLCAGYDIRGRCPEKTFQPTQEYKQVIDWKNDANALEDVVYSHSYVYNNLGQVLEEKDAQGNRTKRRFTRQGQVYKLEFKSVKETDWKVYLSNTVFSADGLPSSITYGNKVTTDLTYDEKSRLLISQRTTRASRGGRREFLEDITHTYDCAGRSVFVHDGAEQVQYVGESCVKPEWDYTYDATGRLISATGRAQLAFGEGNQLRPHSAINGLTPTRGGAPDGNQLYQYLETYKYNLEGNILEMKHEAPGTKGVTSWTRNYFYEEQSLLSDDRGVKSNRLSRTAIGEKNEGKYAYSGDAGLAGCITTLPKFSELDWDMNNMLSFSSTQYVNVGTPERTYYVYDHSGNRVRKVTESAAKPGEEPRKQRDTMFLGGVELQARSDGSNLWIARVGGDTLAMVEVSSSRQKPLVRFQTGDHMELDDDAQLISFEEYSPFGSVVCSAVRGDVEAPRAYRFARYEHDRETGLYHCGQRYYCPWLGRWTSPDPLGDVDGPNLYEYVNNDPINSHDPAGTCGILKRKIAAVQAKMAQSGNQGHERQKNKPFTITKNTPDVGFLNNNGVDERASKEQNIQDPSKKISMTFNGVDVWNREKRVYENYPDHSQAPLVMNGSFNQEEKVYAPQETFWMMQVKWNEKNFTNDKLAANNAQLREENPNPYGEQHHLFQEAYGHLFKAVGLHPDMATIFIDKKLHTVIGRVHDNGWAEFFLHEYKEAKDLNRTSPDDRKHIRQALQNKDSDESKFLMETMKQKDNRDYYVSQILSQVCENLGNTGLTPTMIKNCLRFYGVGYSEKGDLMTWEDFEHLWDDYNSRMQNNQANQ
ncbi:65kDa B protein-domain-containing protein [Mariannaea sp. PMI_226]|nr:65kDa B protein-domain-containing protein [Mariannaea sp. PMI_226]